MATSAATKPRSSLLKRDHGRREPVLTSCGEGGSAGISPQSREDGVRGE